MWSTRQFRALKGDWSPILAALTDEVFVTFDLDALDPGILPGTGTPEPGGLDWFEAVDLLAAVAAKKHILGFDVVELAPIPGQVESDFLAARLTYRMIGLALRSVDRPRGWGVTPPRLRLRKNQDRRVRGGHPWIFSNEIAAIEGDPEPGGLVEVRDQRGAYL